MKKNSPVTNVEHTFSEQESLYSRTNLRGRILEVNDHFVRMSGFSREELQGRAHNIVRHPDIPPEAFKDLWEDLKVGRPWHGVLKNWNKNGGYYWVDANVSPVRDKNRKIVGYQSVRLKPSAEAIRAAEVGYKKINTKNSKVYISHGRIFEKNWLKTCLLSFRFQWINITALAVLPSLFTVLGYPNNVLSWMSLVFVPILVYFATMRQHKIADALLKWLGQILMQGSLKLKRQKLSMRIESF